VKTISECLQRAALLASVSDSPRLDVEVLLIWALGKSRTYLYTWPEHALDDAVYERFDAALTRRIKGEPVAYIVGRREFWSLELFTDNSTLIPRPDTEVLVEQALTKVVRPTSSILDLGTGTGAVALALASELPAANIDAVDFSKAAVQLAQKNCDYHQFKNLNIFSSDWFSHVSGSYDLIVSNPPYIDADDEHLGIGDVMFEPRSALVAANHGLADIEHIAEHARQYLVAGGWLLLEHGWRQGDDVRRVLERAGFCEVVTHKDYAGNDRVSLGCWRS